MIKLMVICPSFRMESKYVRWRMLAQRYPDVDVTLIGPKRWESQDFGSKDVYFAHPPFEEERFRMIPVNMVDRHWMRGGWDSPELFPLVKKYRPDFIYLIGEEATNITFQMALMRRLYVPNAKICAFSMRGLDFPFHSINYRLRWKLACKIYDAYFTHYPRGVEVIRTQGQFTKPIYMQTQVGVNAEIFKKDEKARREVRMKLGIKDDEFVFGSLSRIDIRKGLLDILDALPLKGKSKFLMIGDGPDMARARDEVYKKGLEKAVILPGFISQDGPVATYQNALDCFIHMPKTSDDWIDTFSLAVAQAMAIGLPVIGSDSGGIPYELGDKGIIVPEGDSSALRKAMDWVLDNKDAAKDMGEALRVRVMKSFEISHLTDCFYCTMRDILEGKFNPRHADQQDFQF